MDRGVGNFVIPDQFVLHINIGVILVAEKSLLAFFGKTSIGIFLTLLGLRPIYGRLSLFNLFVFRFAVVLNWHVDDRRVHHLSTFGFKTLLDKQTLKTIEKRLDQFCLGQLVSKKPNGFFIRNGAFPAETQELHERHPVTYLKFYLSIRKIVERLKNQNPQTSKQHQTACVPKRSYEACHEPFPVADERFPGLQTRSAEPGFEPVAFPASLHSGFESQKRRLHRGTPGNKKDFLKS